MLKKLNSLAQASLVGVCTLTLFSSHATNLKHSKVKFSPKSGYLHSLKAKPGEYIVVYQDDVDDATIDNTVDNINNANGANERELQRFNLVKGFAGKVPPGQLQQLIDDPEVKTIEANLSYSLSTTSAASNPAASWGLDRIDQTNLPLDGNYSVAGDGSGVHAYIIDSGILLSHNEFGGRAVWDFTASDITDGNNDGTGRGTHIAGTVGGATYGVANNVNLHAVKVVDNSGNGTLAGLIEGIEYVTNNHQAPAVATIGISMGFSQTLNDALAASTAAGVTYAVATGDDNHNACNYSPASSSEVITVGATWDNDDASGSSNFGSCVDIYAPGLYIKSTWHTGDTHNNTISHSPMAAAHVAGAAAIIRGNDPSCNVSQVKDKLLSYSNNNVLNNVPANSPNVLLGVPQSLDTNACAETTGINVQYDHRVQLNSNTTVNINFVPQNSALPVQHGSLTWDTDHYVYAPNTNYKGLDKFDYIDAQGERKTVRIEVGMAGNNSELLTDATSTNQYYTRVVPLTNGDYIVSWFEQVGSYFAVMFQRFNALGEAVTSKTRVHSANRAQTEPVSGYMSDGGFMIAWVEDQDVYAKRYSANNVGGSVFRVNSYTYGSQSDPAIATLNNGNFVISWDAESQYKMHGNLYSPDGVKLAENFVLATAVGGIHRESNVKPLVNGGFIGMGSADRYIMARQFDENGNVVLDNVVPSAFAGDASQHKQVTFAQLPDGRYMLGWTTTYSTYGADFTVMGRIYNADNTPVTNEFKINQYDPNHQMGLGLQATHDGEFLAIWQSNNGDNDSQAVVARRFDRDGNALSDEFRVTHNWLGAQQQPDITTLQDGQVAIAFTDNNGGVLQSKVAMLTFGGANEDIFQGDALNNTFVGKGGHNTVYAEGGDDIIYDGTLAYGGEGRDIFYRGLIQYGENGNDDFYIGEGQSFIDGGSGYDVVFFTGNYANYTVTDEGNGYYTISDLRVDSPDGLNNQLTGIEAIQFADHRQQLDDSQNQPIAWDSRVQTPTDVAVSIDFSDFTQGSINTTPNNGSLLWNGSSYTYTPNANFSGIDNFVYLASGNQLKTVRVEVGIRGNNASYTVDSSATNQNYSRVVGLTNGDLVVSWIETVGSYSATMFQRFDALGNAITPATQAHVANRHQTEAVVGKLINGGFVLAWVENSDIYAKRFDTNNVGGNAFIVNALQTGNQSDPAITTLVNGDLVIAWDAEQTIDFRANLYDPNGGKRLSDIILTDAIGGIRSEINVKATADGGFIALGSSDRYMVTSKFGHHGKYVNSNKVVSSTSVDATQHKQITMAELPDGHYMVAWTEKPASHLTTDIKGQIYNADNTPVTAKFDINQFSDGNQRAVGVAATESGEFIAIWQAYAADGDGNGWGIMARRYDRNGNALSDEFRIVDNWQGHQYQPDITVLNNGQMALSYSDNANGAYNITVAMLSIGGENDDILQGNNQNNVFIGGEGYNRIYAEGGDDRIVDGTLAYGGYGDDIFERGLVNYGEAGNDTFYIGAGNSTIDGGSDYDVVVFNGNRSDYTITHNPDGSYSISDNRSGNPDGANNTLIAIETVEFANQRISLGASQIQAWSNLVQVSSNGSINLAFNELINGTIDSYPLNGSLIYDSGSNSYIYTPNASFSGVDSFSYLDSNGQLQTVRIEVGLTGNNSGVVVESSNPAQTNSRVMPLSNGDFIVTWQERDGSNKQVIKYQRFNALGTQITFANIVHSSSLDQTEPVVGYLHNGGFVVAWVENQDVYAKIFDANNNGGSAFIVPSNSASLQSDPAIATLTNGDFVIAWDAENSYEFMANIYNSDGVQIRANISLIHHIGGIRSEVNVKTMSDGGFMVLGSADRYIVTRRFNHLGDPINNGVTPSNSAYDATQLKQVSLAELPDGRYMVGWTATQNQDGSGLALMARVYNADDTALTAEFQVNQYAAGDQKALGIAATPNGDFITVWQSAGADGDNQGIRARLFDRDGTAITAEFQLVQNTQGSQFAPDIQKMPNDKLAVSFSDGISGTGKVHVDMISLGDDGDDVMYNTDIAIGGNGDDNFYGGETFDGGSGSDTLHLTGNNADYSIVNNTDGSVTVIDNRSGSPDGTMMLRNMEFIQFSDTNVSL